MALTFIHGQGWVDTSNWGAPAQSNQAVTQEQKSAAFSAEADDRANRFGTTGWINQYFPEYAQNVLTQSRTDPNHMTAGTNLGNDVRQLTHPWESLGFRELWNSTPENQRQALADSLNFYKNGGTSPNGSQSIDPATFRGMARVGETPTGQKIFRNANGTLVGGQPPQKYSETSGKKGFEYGLNAQFFGNNGQQFQTDYYHTVQKDWSPDNTYSGNGKYIPGFANTAHNLGLQRHLGRANPLDYARFTDGLEVGDSVMGRYGFMWDDAVVKRRNAMNNQYPKKTERSGPRGYNERPPTTGGPGAPGTPGTGAPPPGTTPNAPGTGAPPKTPWEDDNTGPDRPPMDYGPAPFDPYPSGYDPYQGQGYQGYGHEGYDYQNPQFGGPSQWGQFYNDWLSGGIDASKYAPELGGQSVAQSLAQDPAGAFTGSGSGTYYDYYRNYIGGGGSPKPGGPVRPH